MLGFDTIFRLGDFAGEQNSSFHMKIKTKEGFGKKYFSNDIIII